MNVWGFGTDIKPQYPPVYKRYEQKKGDRKLSVPFLKIMFY